MIQETDRIKHVNIEDEMKSSYIDYSMSVIVSRALPDVRDGFKPVHRRILYGMWDMGITHEKATKKSAAVVGEVLGKYHPHGDSSVYNALVRMAQPWAMRYPLVIGQGNFGSMDGDGAAAMRYTEAKLSVMGEMMMQDIEKETVDMVANYDNSRTEPSVLPTCIPSFLVNGATGIAVGMATNVPTHNIGEVIDGSIAYIENPEIDTDGLMAHIKGPDFPTGGYIMGTEGIRSAYETGRGRIIMRARTEIETGVLHDKIVIREVPYGTNTSELCTHIGQLAKEGKIDGITNVNDESDREGMRIVVDVRRGQNANVVLNKLFKLTALQASFAVNTIALVPIPGTSPVKMRPAMLTLKDCIRYFVEHRHEVVLRRTAFDKRKAEERAHLLQALITASDNIDEVVGIIKSSNTPQIAIERLQERFNFDEIQARYVALVSRKHTMTPTNSVNMDMFRNAFDKTKMCLMMAMEMTSDNKIVVPKSFADSFPCTRVQIKYAWEVSCYDEAFIALEPDDNPYIPEEHIADAPVLKALESLKDIGHRKL